MSDALDSLPEASLERHVAILGTSDAGKTYAARGEVERLLHTGRRVCIIDPTGVWWGLAFGPDGATPSGFRCLVRGADELIDRGEDLAQTVAEDLKPGDALVLDVSRLTVGQRTKFFAEFAEELARINREPLHLVIDEAHQFAPQGRVHDPISGRMVHAANNLVSGGRALGIRVMMLSQRPAKLHKDSLTQVQTLVAMLNVSPQDRAAVKTWIADSADPERGKEIIASLPGLPVGEGWIWAPRLDVLSRVKFRPIRTYDSSATPEHGASASAPRRSPKNKAHVGAVFLLSDEIAAAEKRGFERGSKGAIDAGLRGYKDGYDKGWSAAMAKVRELAESSLPGAKANTIPASQAVEPAPTQAAARAAPRPAGDSPTQKVYDALLACPRWPATWDDIAILAVMSAAGGAFRSAKKRLIEEGRVDVADDGRVFPPPKGETQRAIDVEQLLDAWEQKLGGAAAKMLRVVREGPANSGGLAGYLGLSEAGGYFRKEIKSFRRAGMVVERNGLFELAPVVLQLRGVGP